MKTLTLLRHAKSGWDDEGLRDFDRPLNPKGRRAAQAIGRRMRRDALAFDAAIASPARRVVETLAEVEAAYGTPLAPEWDQRLYLAPAAAILEIVHALPETHGRVLLVGHNPGLEDLVLDLVGKGDLRRAVAEKYPTAALAELCWDRGWRDACGGAATLARFIRPRDLDPTLGPDAED